MTSVPTLTISVWQSQITHLQSQLVSAGSVLQTLAASKVQRSLYREMLQISASLQVNYDQILLLTLTNTQVLAELTQSLIQDQAELQHVLDSNSPYGGLVPNMGFNVLMLVIFCLITAFHVFGLWYKQWWFSIAMLFANILQILGYIGRVISHSQLENLDAFLLQFICLTIAPVFTMGGIYYQLAKLSTVYGDQYSRFTPILYSYIFITCDVISLIIQAIGGGMAGVAVQRFESTTKGTHIFVAGLALQVFSMSLFLILWFDFLYSVKHRAKKDSNLQKISLDALYNPDYQSLRSRWVFSKFEYLLTLSVIFVYIRCIYRVCELLEGWRGNLITHEKYFIALDGVMMSLANVIFLPFFPGFVFDGRHTTIPIKKIGKPRQEKTSEEKLDF